jgi:hypothetical protein
VYSRTCLLNGDSGTVRLSRYESCRREEGLYSPGFSNCKGLKEIKQPAGNSMRQALECQTRKNRKGQT